MHRENDKNINFPDSTEAQLGRTNWLLNCTNEVIADERAKIALLQTQIRVLEKTPAGGFFTPDVHCVVGKWSCLAWKDSNGIHYRVTDASLPKCIAKHVLSQPAKTLALAAVIAIGLGTLSLAGEAYQVAESNGNIDKAEKKLQQGFYQVIEGALKLRDKFL